MFRVARTGLTRILLTLAVALLPVLGGISSGIHMLLVRHEVCLAHGEFIHAAQSCSAQAASSKSESGVSGATYESGPARGPDADEHCQLVLVTRSSFLSWNGGERGALDLREGVACIPRHRADAAPSIAQILLAPKHSPPA